MSTTTLSEREKKNEAARVRKRIWAARKAKKHVQQVKPADVVAALEEQKAQRQAHHEYCTEKGVLPSPSPTITEIEQRAGAIRDLGFHARPTFRRPKIRVMTTAELSRDYWRAWRNLMRQS